MDAITALHQRVSSPRLTAPAPNNEQLDILFRAAGRAADHGNMRPWRFVVIEGKGLDRLGEIFVKAATAKNPEITTPEIDRFLSMPKRAPMIILAIAKCQPNPKVSDIEQIIAAGAATQNLLNAAFALEIGAVWRTGDMAYDPLVKQALGVQENETLIGFIYIGTPTTLPQPPREQKPEDFFSKWSPE